MKNREHWGSRLGFILAASGSAVGLGNIWKYPHMAGENGGAAFTVIYLICILLVGLPIVIAEFVIGRKTQLSPVGAFKTLAPNTNWKYVGVLGVCSAFVILSFYGVVGGWTLRYALLSLVGGFGKISGNPELAGEQLRRQGNSCHTVDTVNRIQRRQAQPNDDTESSATNEDTIL